MTFRWGTWIRCGVYIAEKFALIKEWVDNLPDDGIIISSLKSAFANSAEQTQLVNLLVYEIAIKLQVEMQAQGQTVISQLHTLGKFKEAIFSTDATDKFIAVLTKNPDLEFVTTHPALFAYVPLTSCEVERLFSLLKINLENCRNIKLETVQKLLFMRI